MESNKKGFRWVISAFCFILLCFCCWVTRSYADCGSENYTESSQFAKNVEIVLDHLVKASKQAAAFNVSIIGEANTTVYGLFQCRGDKIASQCFDCAQSAKIDLPKLCPLKQRASIWDKETCFMRYRDDDFINSLQLNKVSDSSDGGNVSDPENFNKVVRQLLTNLSVEAVSSSSSSSPTRFATGSTNSTIVTVYGMVQCWDDLSMDNCRTCLDDNLAYILSKYSGIREADVVSHNCLTRYATDEFFAPTNTPSAASPPPPAAASGSGGSDGSKNKVAIILGTIGGSALILLLLLGGLLVWFKKDRKTTGALDEEENILKRDDPIIYTVEVLKRATDDFHDDLKLGEGGFGAVYKGTLPNGTIIAVKKLCFRSTQAQGQKEFINEIKLLIKIQHRNLVSLLGCCVDGHQKMLVYEYLSNKSIDKILFDPNKKVLLDWNLRFHIILGVAKGLMYLHEDSKHKIIHRDIKAANILLDDNFNPKIADFGLAKLFPEDQTNIHTKVAGTYGYMSPEYAMKGQLSTKADVYSFGVLVLEIINGRKNGDLDVSSGQSILTKIWRLFQQGNVEDIVDESMASNISYEQVVRCIHVGFLCTQIDSSLRPSMSAVFLMLTSASLSLPTPVEPAFLSFNSGGDSVSYDGNQSSMRFPR